MYKTQMLFIVLKYALYIYLIIIYIYLYNICIHKFIIYFDNNIKRNIIIIANRQKITIRTRIKETKNID